MRSIKRTLDFYNMDDSQRKYYHDMLRRDRGRHVIKDGHLIGVITVFIGDDDEKYLTNHEPWTVVDDDENGETLYIDQLLSSKKEDSTSYVHREFTRFLKGIKKEFPNIKRAKWVRVDANFRKHGIKEGVKQYVHCKNFKF